MGRPRKEIDKAQFEKLCKIQCALDEIADWFNCSEDTIERWCKRTYQDEDGNPLTFAEVYKKYSAGGKIVLRRAQMKLAEKNATMAIFLGKNYLGQTDKTEIEDTTAYEKLDEILKGIRDNAINDKAE